MARVVLRPAAAFDRSCHSHGWAWAGLGAERLCSRGAAPPHPAPCLSQLLSLNLSDNRLYRLDDMVDLPLKAPSLKILNLSSNLVGHRHALAPPAPRAPRWGSPASLPRLTPSALPVCALPSQLKSDRDLDKLKGLKLEELWLDSNPLCDNFRDQSTYIR